ncbi:hypothetical protein HF909_18395 (plasmid) [Ralstonia pseudosolanacearum]|uniref:Uncharacterized protein n=1 Tax=Ralstonia solanacearum TaxID=305 RepID=A0AA92K4W9_RALSL|nr:hypothetical protein [Ralstonia pseudosolanacearum]QOK98455.1 hypothetical protein HF909_18395 [Ralstonia pseudosolanacearum]
MASLLGIYRRALRIGVHAGCSGGLALIVAAVLLAGTAEAQAQVVGSVSNQSVTVGVRQGADSTAAVNGSSMAISTNLIATVALAGVSAAAIAVPAVRVLQVGAGTMALAGRMAMRSGVGQAALLGIIATLGGDVSVNGSGSLVAPAVSANAGDIGFNGFGWQYAYNRSASGGNMAYGVAASAGAACSAMLAADMFLAGQNAKLAGSRPTGDGTTYECHFTNNGGSNFYAGVGRLSSCISGYVLSGSVCKPDPSVTQPATDAQIEAAIKAYPASWPQIFNAAGCGKATSFADLSSADPNDPCVVVIGGATPQSNGVTWPNGNTATFPARMTTTSGTDANGRPVTVNNTTTTSASLSGTDSRTNPITATPTTATTTTTNTTNADGSTTSTTTTTTTTAPSSDSTDDQTATFAGPDISLYKAKTKTFSDVLTGFRTRVAAMPWYTATVGFFNVTISGGSCPHWTVSASRWSPALDASVYFCSPTAMTLYQLGGVVVMIVASWAAFRIGLL